MHYRANICFISKLVFTSVFIFLGQANWQQSKKYIEKGGEHNEAFVGQIFNIVQYTLISMTIGRLLLMLISLKNLAICKTYIYYQAVFMIVEMFLPRNYGDMQLKLLMIDNAMNFVLLFHNFWPSCISMLSCQLVILATNKLIYEKEVDTEAIVECIGGLVYQFFNFFMINIATNLLGLLFVKAEILRGGNVNLLNEMREGIIIMDQETGVVLFVNKAAKALNIRESAEFSMSFDS